MASCTHFQPCNLEQPFLLPQDMREWLPPDQQIKWARGFWQFLLRGLSKVGREWGLICLTHNLLKVHRSGWKVQTA